MERVVRWAAPSPRAFAREGAADYRAGRTIPPLQAVAQEIARAGRAAGVTIVDALDEPTVCGRSKRLPITLAESTPPSTPSPLITSRAFRSLACLWRTSTRSPVESPCC
jgi:hypothetical protein